MHICANNFAVGSHSKNISKIVVIVDDKVITDRDIENRSRMIAYLSDKFNEEKFIKSLYAAVKQRLIDELIYHKMAEKFKMDIKDDMLVDYVKDYADKYNLTIKDFENKLKSLNLLDTFKDMLRTKVIMSYIVMSAFPKELNRISEKKIDSELKKHKNDEKKTHYHISEIVFNVGNKGKTAKDLANETYENLLEIRKNMPILRAFRIIAQQVSQSYSSSQGGDLGWLSEDQMNDNTHNAVKNLRIGEFSRPFIDSSGNYKIVILNDQKKPGKEPFMKSEATVAVVSIPFSQSMNKEQMEQIERRIPMILESKNQKDFQSIANDFKYKFAIQEKNVSDLPEFVLNSKRGLPLQPVFSGKSLDIYMVIDIKEKNAENSQEKEMREIIKKELEQKNRFEYAEKIFKTFKGRTLIKHKL